MILPPFPLLAVHTLRSPSNIYDYAEYTASFRMPDGRDPKGLPAANKAVAIHNLLVADAAPRQLSLPFANTFLPLCDAALRLCDAFSWLLYHEALLDDLLMDRSAQGHPLPAEETSRAVHAVLEAIQSTVEEARRVPALLQDVHADPHAGATRDHPLTVYVEWFAAPWIMDYCKATLDALGIQGEITTGAGVAFTVDAALDDPRWPAVQAGLLTEQRQGLLRHYVGWMQWLEAAAPSEEAFRKRIEAAIDDVAAIYNKRTGRDLRLDAT